MKIYRYENATVYITKPQEKHLNNIRKATVVFLKKVSKEKNRHGNIYSSRSLKRKQVLDQ